MDNLLDKGYCVTLDNFYTSPELAELLIAKRTDMFGTLRLNRRGLPQQLKDAKLKKGEIIGFQKGKICAMKFMDKKPISILSTVHNTKIVEHQKKRKTNDGRAERVPPQKKPQAIVDYNFTMGGVDKADQCLSYYPTVRNQQKKYYLKIFRHILNQCVWNCFVLYKKNKGTLSHLDFRLELVTELIKTYGDTKVSSHSASGDRLTGRHFPSSIEPTLKKKNPTRVCVVCALTYDSKGQRIRRESRYQCKKCNVALCVDPCFEKYHTVERL
ncbi:hypothetical protein JTE90_020606 [Oedothorax gibbosus]|nr:hypothetical protein JTE90_020606 [Oedothorax gibbosus]